MNIGQNIVLEDISIIVREEDTQAPKSYVLTETAGEACRSLARNTAHFGQ